MKVFVLALMIFSTGFAAEEVFINDLNGILFTSSKECIWGRNEKKAPGIAISDLFVPEELDFVYEMEDFLGGPVTLNTFGLIKNATVAFYKKHGYPIVGAVIPKQDITEGYLSVIVVVGKLGNLEAKGAKYFSNKKIAGMISTKKGEIIETDQMLRDIDWINQNPFRTTDLIYEPGKNLGETNALLLTEDAFPLRIFGGYQNTGNLIAGSNRFYTGFNWGNAWWVGHQLNYQFMSADRFNKWWAQIVNYIVPLPWKNILELYGAFIRSKPPEGVDTDLKGHNWQIFARYNVPFVTLGFLKNNFVVSYEFKRTNNFLSFASDDIFDDDVDISQFVLGYEIDMNYMLGMTSMGVSLFMSPGGMTKYNHDEDFSNQRIGAPSNYVYSKLRFDQTLLLPWKFSWVFNSLFQLSSSKLLPSEEMSLGGYTTVRGYEENEVIGDNGILLKTEFRTPPLPIKKMWDIPHELQFLVFFDFGYTSDADESILFDRHELLASAGPGVRYMFGEYINFRFDYGWQIDSITRRVDDSDDHSRAHLGLVVSF